MEMSWKGSRKIRASLEIQCFSLFSAINILACQTHSIPVLSIIVYGINWREIGKKGKQNWCKEWALWDFFFFLIFQTSCDDKIIFTGERR